MRLCFGALALVCMPGLAWAGPPRRALVVGANDGGTDLPALRYAETDAGRMADVLDELGEFDAVEVLLTPTVGELRKALHEAAAHSDQDGVFVFYYSGHADAGGLRLRDEVLLWSELKGAIRQVPADVHLGILDACRSGAITQVKGAKLTESFMELATKAEGEAWLAASSADEDAQESDRLHGSFFTHYLLSGLRGAADDGSGHVSLHEAYAYAYDRTVARTAGTAGGTQHPAYEFMMQGNGQLELTHISKGESWLVFPRDLAGLVTVVRMSDGVPVAEFAKRAGAEGAMALDPGQYMLRRRTDGSLYEVQASLARGARLEVNRWGSADGEAARLKGGLHSTRVHRVPVAAVLDSLTFGMAFGEGASMSTPGPAPATAQIAPVVSSSDSVTTRESGIFGDHVANSPTLVGLVGIVPGLGHIATRRYRTAAAFMGATFGLAAAGFGIGTRDEFGFREPGFNVLHMGALMTWGWSIASAVRGVGEPDTTRHRKGTDLAFSAGWHQSLTRPAYVGFSVDFIPVAGLSFGLDRIGVGMDESAYYGGVGMRLMAAPRWGHLRPGVFVAAAIQVAVRQHDFELLRTYGLYSVGLDLRYFVTPRYYLSYDLRGQYDGLRWSLVQGAVMGLRVGGKRTR